MYPSRVLWKSEYSRLLFVSCHDHGRAVPVATFNPERNSENPRINPVTPRHCQRYEGEDQDNTLLVLHLSRLPSRCSSTVIYNWPASTSIVPAYHRRHHTRPTCCIWFQNRTSTGGHNSASQERRRGTVRETGIRPWEEVEPLPFARFPGFPSSQVPFSCCAAQIFRFAEWAICSSSSSG